MKVKTMTFAEFVKEIHTYESDTFSAEGSRMKKREARQVAEAILSIWVDYKLDGIAIDAMLEEIRKSNKRLETQTNG